MIHIAPLLSPSQPASQTTTTAGSSKESESIFGQILGQKVASEQSHHGKPPATRNSSSPKALPEASEQHTTSPEFEDPAPPDKAGTTAVEAVAIEDGYDEQQSNEKIVTELQNTFTVLTSGQFTNATTETKSPPVNTATGQENASQATAVPQSAQTNQSGIQQQLVTAEESIANVSKGVAGTYSDTPDNSPFSMDKGIVLPSTNTEIAEKSASVRQSPHIGQTQVFQSQEVPQEHNSVVASLRQPSVTATHITTIAANTSLSSSSVPGLLPADAALTGNESITISGYFTAAKSDQSALPFQGNTATHQGLSHLAIIAEQTPVTMAAPLPGAAYTPQQMTADTAPLMVSLNQLTTIKSPAIESEEKYRPLISEPLRQQFHDQQLQIKTEAKTSEGNEQQFASKQGTATATQTGPLQTPGTSTTGQPLTFSEVSQAVMASTQVHSAPVAPQPTVPAVPLSPVMYDSSVLQQVAERFQIHMQNQETKLRIQLQPAELGKLDINLTVKDGTIRAHVVAQSGQVQELLERNMSKLKGILETQGFSIEEIIVSTASESISNSDLFHDQAPAQQNTAGTKSHFSDTLFSDTLDSIVTSGAEPATSVNITA